METQATCPDIRTLKIVGVKRKRGMHGSDGGHWPCGTGRAVTKLATPLTDAIKAWAKQAMQAGGWRSQRAMARDIGVSPSALNALMRSGSAHPKTMQAVAEGSGLPPPFGRSLYEGLPEPPARALAEPEPGETAGTADLFGAPQAGLQIWPVQSDSLVPMGIRRGDVVLVDPNRRAVRGDAVIVQLREAARLAARTVLRVYQPPYVVGWAPGDWPEVEAVDDDLVAIAGVILRVLTTPRP